MQPKDRMRQLLDFLYGPQQGVAVYQQLERRLDAFAGRNPELSADVTPPDGRLSEQDAILITYGDQFQESGRSPLQSLHRFLTTHLDDAISGVHVLPFFPYSSDDGFSVIDYEQVDPNLGTWEDIGSLGQDFRLMFDAVINHISRHSTWFQGFLRGQDPYMDYFIVVDPDADLSTVVRPRALPLLTAVDSSAGVQYVWTTFSDDQIDLNYASPQLMLEIIDVLLTYVERGAEIIRLDAIAYLWKELGSTCIHLPQTHAVVKLWRAVLDAVAPEVIIITETNVPHEENVSYFGRYLDETGSTDEAQMVYNFSLAPLTMDALLTGDATRLSKWAAGLETPSPGATFFNFIASHDGIGVRPAEGILSAQELQALVDRTLEHGGQVSYKANPDGSKSVYELNITLYDFLNDPQNPMPELDVGRFLASQAVLLSLSGVPGIYVHSLFGSRNCQACLAQTGRARSINREKFQVAELEALLAEPSSHHQHVFQGYSRLLRLRRGQRAFHPGGSQQVLAVHDSVFALLRRAPDTQEPLLCLINLSPTPVDVKVELGTRDLSVARSWHDLVGGATMTPTGGVLEAGLAAYQVRWLV